MTLVDARGVEISPGDTCLYGFGVGRSVAMAEGVVLSEKDTYADMPTASPRFVSLTASGRVRVRIIRRSYGGGGEKPVVDIAPDRLVVLKPSPYPELMGPHLPPSPLPTQDEANRQRIENLIEAYTADLRATEIPDRPDRHYYEGWSLAEFHAFAAVQLDRLRKELRELDGG